MALGARHSGHMRERRSILHPAHSGRSVPRWTNIAARVISWPPPRSTCSLCPPLLIDHDYEAALELIEHGLATTSRNSERILEAELYRLKARVLVVRGGPDVEAEGAGTARPGIEHGKKPTRQDA